MSYGERIPIAIDADATSAKIQCGECVREKNEHVDGRAWSRGEDHSDIDFVAELPLDEDFAFVRCPYGHEVGIVRRGTERAANFGIV